MSSDQNAGEKLRINRGRVDSLSLYEITEHELDLLEKGSPDSTYFSFAIFFISTAISFTATLLTTKIESDRLFDFFALLVLLGYGMGSVLLALWWRNKKSMATVIKKIRGRIALNEEKALSSPSVPLGGAQSDAQQPT